MKIRLGSGGVWVSVVQVYGPTEDSKEEEVKEGFYEQLQTTLREVHKQDKLIVMGDLNAGVGRNVECVEARRGGGEWKRKRLLQFCAENELVVGNTWFQHKDIHKFTWECRGKNQRFIIDYILVRKGMKRQLIDVKVLRGAEIGSDQYLVMMVIKLELKVEKPNRSRAGGGSIRVRS